MKGGKVGRLSQGRSRYPIHSAEKGIFSYIEQRGQCGDSRECV